jgi:hypothetical protein
MISFCHKKSLGTYYFVATTYLVGTTYNRVASRYYLVATTYCLLIMSYYKNVSWDHEIVSFVHKIKKLSWDLKIIRHDYIWLYRCKYHLYATSVYPQWRIILSWYFVSSTRTENWFNTELYFVYTNCFPKVRLKMSILVTHTNGHYKTYSINKILSFPSNFPRQTEYFCKTTIITVSELNKNILK